MQKLKNFLPGEYVLVFLFCLAVIQGPAFSLIDTYDQATCVDCQTYMGIARFDFNQSPVRRYRPIVPLIAGGINYVFGNVFKKLQPGHFSGDFSLGFSFFIVNNILIGLWGVVIYRYCKVFGTSKWAAIAGILVMLTCRWTSYIAGAAMVDSLYCLVLGLSLLGIQERNTKLTLLAVFLGPFAKESFIFIAPVIFFFSHISKPRLLFYFLLSGIFVFIFRYCYDHFAGFPANSGLISDIDHVKYIKDSIRKLFSFHGVYDVFSNFGMWVLLPAFALMSTHSYWAALKQKAKWYMLFFGIAVLIHMLLSGYLERMFYLAMPIICLTIAIAADEIRKQYFVTEKINLFGDKK
jgi:hypothetical protein